MEEKDLKEKQLAIRERFLKEYAEKAKIELADYEGQEPIEDGEVTFNVAERTVRETYKDGKIQKIEIKNSDEKVRDWMTVKIKYDYETLEGVELIEETITEGRGNLDAKKVVSYMDGTKIHEESEEKSSSSGPYTKEEKNFYQDGKKESEKIHQENYNGFTDAIIFYDGKEDKQVFFQEISDFDQEEYPSYKVTTEFTDPDTGIRIYTKEELEELFKRHPELEEDYSQNKVFQGGNLEITDEEIIENRFVWIWYDKESGKIDEKRYGEDEKNCTIEKYDENGNKISTTRIVNGKEEQTHDVSEAGSKDVTQEQVQEVLDEIAENMKDEKEQEGQTQGE